MYTFCSCTRFFIKKKKHDVFFAFFSFLGVPDPVEPSFEGWEVSHGSREGTPRSAGGHSLAERRAVNIGDEQYSLPFS